MPETEIDIRAILGLLRRRFRLIAVTVITIVSLAGVAIFALTPIYTATALVLVDTSRKNLLEPEAAMTNSTTDSARVESEVELLRSDNVLMQVIQDLNLISDREFGVSLGLRSRILAMLRLDDGQLPSGDEALSQVLNKVRANISAQRRGLTYLIAVQARSESPARAAELANALTRAYISDQVSSKVSNTLASLDILQARIEQARQAIVDSESSFDTFISDNIDRIVAESGDQNVADLRRQVDALESAREESLRTVDLVQQNLQAENWSGLASTLASDAVRALEQQRSELAGELATLAAGSATAIDLQAELASIDDELRQAATTELSALQSAIGSNQTAQDNLRQSIRNNVINTRLPAGVLTQIYELQQNAAIARAQYENLLARAQDLGAQADLQVADSRIVSQALVPATPSFPNPQLILMLSAVLALGVGVGLALLYENYIGGFVSEEQVENVLRTKVVSSVPKQRNVKPGQLSIADLVATAPISAFSESIRRVRAAVDRSVRSSNDPGSVVIMVTSTAPGEGKTTASLALARSYALTGKRTLLIDCDMRKPSLHQHLGLGPSSGLVDFLSDQNNLSALTDILAQDPISDVVIIPGARRTNKGTDQLIASPAFARLIQAARSSFDIIILDTPPLGPVVDGLYIANNVDAIIFAVRYSATRQSEARQAVASLMQAKPDNVDVFALLSQQDVSRHTYSSQYGSYYVEES